MTTNDLAIQAATAQGERNERQRIIALAEDLKFTLWRPSLDGPGGTDLALDVVPLSDLLQRLREESNRDA